MSIRVPRSVGFGAQRALRPDIATGALPGLARHPNWPIAYWRHRGPASSVRVIPDPASAIYLRYLLRYHALSFRQCLLLFAHTSRGDSAGAPLRRSLRFLSGSAYPGFNFGPGVPAARWAPARRGLRLGNTRELGSLPRLCRGRGNWGEAQLVLCRIVHTPLLHCHTWHTLMQIQAHARDADGHPRKLKTPRAACAGAPAAAHDVFLSAAFSVGVGGTW